MKYGFQIADGHLSHTNPENAKITVYTKPDPDEKNEIRQLPDMDLPTLESILDPDEISRMEQTPDRVLIIWKKPDSHTYSEQLKFEVSSFGLILQDGKMIAVFAEDMVPFESREFQRVRSVIDLILKILLNTTHHYLGHLKAIKMISQELESKISASMGNRYLIQMFGLSESLIYYYNALEANSGVLQKIRPAAERIGFTAEDIELLDDVMIETQQACKQAKIYNTVLSGLMDARGSIVNNNMNTLLKNLTIINVVFLPLNLIAGIGGMSEFSALSVGVNRWLAYVCLVFAMIGIGSMTWYWLTRILDKSHHGGGN